jgi:beta-phosphoglucomutase-like phosphatase (HAD superfamily)
MRKGRMNHMMKTGFGLKPGFSTVGGAGFDDVRPMFRSSRIDASKYAQSTKEESPFDIVDKNLESAQALCEVSAHQFLRSGDCGAELEKTVSRLEIVLATARSEAERLRAELEKARAQQILKDDQKRSKPDPKILKSDKVPVNGIDGTIEVDDDSDSSSVSIDIKAFRRSRNR